MVGVRVLFPLGRWGRGVWRGGGGRLREVLMGGGEHRRRLGGWDKNGRVGEVVGGCVGGGG